VEPDSPQYLFNQAELLLDFRRNEEALPLLQRAVAINPLHLRPGPSWARSTPAGTP
jgi:tetratricopeptide (TPR) repeat protein